MTPASRLPRFLLALPVLGLIGAGLAAVLLPAAGMLPALGLTTPSLAPFLAFLKTPHVPASLAASLWTGALSTLLALMLALYLAAGFERRTVLRLLLPPMLAVPHLSLALGLDTLFGPAGWLVRLLSPWATGLVRPPNWPEQPFLAGLPLVLGLVLKETPFLLLAAAAALPALGLERQGRVAAGLGYGPVEAWWKLSVPRLLPYLRLPLLAVLVYGVTNVEMAAVLGPTTPPPLSLRLLQGFRDPDLAARTAASAGACVLALGVFALALPLCMGRPFMALSAPWRLRGPSGRRGLWTRSLSDAGTIGLLAFWALAGAMLVLWSSAGPWRFPAVLPDRLDATTWTGTGLDGLLGLTGMTALIATAAAGLAALLALLELETRPRGAPAPFWVYLPLLLPQIAFVPGVGVLYLSLHLEGTFAAVIVLHALMALPYAHLFLAEAHRGIDPRYVMTARALGHGPLAVFWRVRLPLLRPALLACLAVGFAVSCGLYLPTLFAGAGRIVTLPVEALALGSGGDRRLIAALGLVLALLPLLAFALRAALQRAWR